MNARPTGLPATASLLAWPMCLVYVLGGWRLPPTIRRVNARGGGKGAAKFRFSGLRVRQGALRDARKHVESTVDRVSCLSVVSTQQETGNVSHMSDQHTSTLSINPDRSQAARAQAKARRRVPRGDRRQLGGAHDLSGGLGPTHAAAWRYLLAALEGRGAAARTLR